MSAMTLNHDLNAAAEFPLTLGRAVGGGMTQKEFAKRLTAWMRKKGMSKLTLGGGPARVKEVAPSPKSKVQSDVWGML